MIVMENEPRLIFGIYVEEQYNNRTLNKTFATLEQAQAYLENELELVMKTHTKHLQQITEVFERTYVNLVPNIYHMEEEPTYHIIDMYLYD